MVKPANERARDNAFRQWFNSWKAGAPHSDADVRKWGEAFKAGWDAHRAAPRPNEG